MLAIMARESWSGVVAKDSKKSRAVSKQVVRAPSFGPAPLLPTDEAAGYDELLARISAHVKPSDPIEALYTRDIVDLTWELLRYRRYKARILEGAVPRALEEKLAPFVNDRHRFGALPHYDPDGARQPTPAMELVSDWIKHDAKAVERVGEILASAKLTMEDVRAHALLLELSAIERLDRLIASTEARRNGVMREIERYRALLAHALQTATREAEDAEFEIVRPEDARLEAREH